MKDIDSYLGLSVKIGGMIGINCLGINVVKYGMMKDWVINLIVVFVDGIVIKMWCCLCKFFVGYNFNGLFVGLEGILGFVIEVMFKFVVILEEFLVVVVIFFFICDVVFVVVEVM